MSLATSSTLLQVGAPLLTLLLVSVITRVRRVTARDLGIALPSWRRTSFWLIAFVVLVSVEEFVTLGIDVGAGQPWRQTYTLPLLVLRTIGIVLLAPLAEELVFRGLLYHNLHRTRLGVVGAIVVPAILFALVHIQYTPVEMAFVLLDGLFFGVVRYATGSVLVPWGLHSLGNLYAVIRLLLG